MQDRTVFPERDISSLLTLLRASSKALNSNESYHRLGSSQKLTSFLLVPNYSLLIFHNGSAVSWSRCWPKPLGILALNDFLFQINMRPLKSCFLPTKWAARTWDLEIPNENL